MNMTDSEKPPLRDATKDIPEEILRLKNRDGNVDLRPPNMIPNPAAQPMPAGPVNVSIMDKEEKSGMAASLAEEVIKADVKINDQGETSLDEIEVRTPRPKEIGPDWVRIDPPSRMVPYEEEALFIKRFGITDIEAIHAAMDSNSVTLYLDALDAVLSMDVRDLTPSDLIYVQYMWRIKSYPSSPYRVDWTSRYGNDHTTRITDTTLDVKWLDMSKEDYAAWKAKGISFPTVRESEAIRDMVSDKDASKAFIANYAQYVYLDEPPSVDSFQKKIKMLREGSADHLVDIQEFASKVEHGVIEAIEVTDEHFEPHAAAKFLEEQASRIMGIAENLASDDSMQGMDNSLTLLTLSEEASNYLEEAKAIRAAIEYAETNKETTGGVVNYAPRKETIALRTISPQDMFPSGKA